MTETFGERLRRLRLAKRMTTPQMANACQVTSYHIVNQWELDRNHPRVSTLPHVASVLGVTTDYLLTGRDSDAALRAAILRGTSQEILLAMARREI
jgi:transcriptional regulator with XRE-family HTH domain